MLEFLFNKIASLQGCNFIKKKLRQRCFKVKFCEIFRNTYFEEYLQSAASGDVVQIRLRQRCTRNLLVQCWPRPHIEAATEGVL